MPNLEFGELSAGRLRIHSLVANIADHPLANVVQERGQFVFLTFDDQFDLPVGQILNKSVNFVPLCYRLSRIPEADALDMALIANDFSLLNCGHMPIPIASRLRFKPSSSDGFSVYPVSAGTASLDPLGRFIYSPRAMQSLQYSRIRWIGALALALAICGLSSAADDHGVVLLRSGGVLQGKITINGERYVVTGPKSVVDVSASQVLLLASSLDDAYAQQRQQLPSETAEVHLKLAEWCLRYHLLPAAQQELADARKLDSRDPRIELLDRRLSVASHPQQTANQDTSTDLDEESLSQKELRELEAIAKELPPGAVERFTRKVQPLLVNSCTASGCHRPGGKQDYQLDRAVLYGLSNRRITLRNLVATLELVNRDSPQQSELVTVPRRTHGGMKRPVFGPRQQARLTQLVDWIGQIAEISLPLQPATLQSVTESGPIKAHGFQARSSDTHPGISDSLVEPSSREEFAALLATPEIKFGANLRPWQPKDEFDPEIFNRRMAKADSTAKSGITAGAAPAMAP